jgi:hypothetical protein
MFRYFLMFFVIVTTACSGNSLSVEQRAALNVFIETLLKNTETGYVILKEKPACIVGYFYTDPLPVDSETHKQCTALRAGVQIWKNLSDFSSDTILHTCENPDPLLPRYSHILVINKPLFHKVVNENLSLFQYVLGPKTTSQSLLKAVLSNKQTFYSLLKGNKVLIGIILGYGKQNSLYVSRKEFIQDALEENTPPFLPNNQINKEFSHEFLPFDPSFDFSSISQEFNFLQNQTTTSSPQLISESPQFIFGWVDSENTKKRLHKLEESQRIINKSLLSFTSLDHILSKLGKKSCIKESTEPDSFAPSDINELLARNIWEAQQKYDSDYFHYFLEGMKKMEIHGKMDRLAGFPEYRRTVLKAKSNLQEADQLFEKLKLDSRFYTLIPSQLCYRVIKTGSEETTCEGNYLSVSYNIFNPEDLCIATQTNVQINLKNTIPAFATAVKGMRIDETREIFIHPVLAYGFDTSLEKCIYLRAVVQLHNTYNNQKFDPVINAINLDFIKDSDYLTTIENNYKNAIISRAVKIALRLKESDTVDLSQVIKHLQHFHENRETPPPILTQRERDLLNQVYWNIYFLSKSFSIGKA